MSPRELVKALLLPQTSLELRLRGTGVTALPTHPPPSPPRCAGAAHDWRPDVTWWQGISGGERTPRGPFYTGWRTELNDLQEEPVAL